MRYRFLKLFIGIIMILWMIYFMQHILVKKEGFIPKINSLYRPYIRKIGQHYETFIGNYGPNIMINNLKKWGIY